MLGNYMAKYFHINSLWINRHVISGECLGLDATDKESHIRARIEGSFELKSGDVIINCIGVINKLVEQKGIENTIIVNSLFPHVLDRICNDNGLHLITVSSDCCYSGLKENNSVGRCFNYSESDPHDATDIYGKTKSLGEPANSTVIRTSIIGEEKVNKRSLLEWVKSNKGKEIDGYVNHRWNGVTCLRLAQVIGEIIEKDLYWKGVKHIFGETVTKYELCRMISQAYDLGITVHAIATTKPCDRSLWSERKDVNFPYYNELYKDIIAQKEFGT
jgi:dTDP-4-dehydrorhamnose reductase